MTFAGPRLQRLLVEFGDRMGDFCGDERILAENRRLNVAWVSTQLRLYWSKEGVYASYTPDAHDGTRIQGTRTLTAIAACRKLFVPASLQEH